MDCRAPETDFPFAPCCGAEAMRLPLRNVGTAVAATTPAAFEDAPEEIFI